MGAIGVGEVSADGVLKRRALSVLVACALSLWESWAPSMLKPGAPLVLEQLVQSVIICVGAMSVVGAAVFV